MTSIMVTIMIDTDDGCRSGCMSRLCAADEADTDGAILDNDDEDVGDDGRSDVNRDTFFTTSTC